MDNAIDLIAWREKAIQQQITEWHKLILSEAGSAALLEAKTNHETLLHPLFEKLRDLYTIELPIVKLREESDVVLHAEGKDIGGENPQLRAVNLLGQKVRTQFGKLAVAVMPSGDDQAIAASKEAQWEITGLVPGSIYMGFALQRSYSAGGFAQSGEKISDLIVNAAKSVSEVPQFIGDHGVNEGLTEVITDPALRDAAMMAAMDFAPTKSSSFDSVEILVPGGSSGVLHTRQRNTLRQALIKPMMRKKQNGAFLGELNQIDLDAGRFQLRNVPGIGTIRCVMELTPDSARNWLGNKVVVSGIYDTDVAGRPRLMRATNIEVANQ